MGNLIQKYVAVLHLGQVFHRMEADSILKIVREVLIRKMEQALVKAHQLMNVEAQSTILTAEMVPDYVSKHLQLVVVQSAATEIPEEMAAILDSEEEIGNLVVEQLDKQIVMDIGKGPEHRA